MPQMHSPFIMMYFFFIVMLLTFNRSECEGILFADTINVSTPLTDNSYDTLVSGGNRFELGFFTPQGSEKTYVGIWYYNKLNIPRTVVWVANRDEPWVHPCVGVFGIADDGNIKIWCDGDTGVGVPVSTLDTSRSSNRSLQLLDSGNLVLVDGQHDKRLWQSFDYPTDTFLPGMEMNDHTKLTCWNSSTDPGVGYYTFGRDQGVYTILKRTTVHWKSGEPGPFPLLNNDLPSIVAQIFLNPDTGLNQQNSQSVRNFITYHNNTRPSSFYHNSRILMNSSGEIQYYNYSTDGGGKWLLFWSAPQTWCSVYDSCGKFGICNNLEDKPMCQCPPGFTPTSSEHWSNGEYSEGCDRMESIKCNQNQTDKFIKLTLARPGGQVLPFDQAQKRADCQKECLDNCKCEAYWYTARNITDRDTGKPAAKCWIWTAQLENLHGDYTDNNKLYLSLRVPSSAVDCNDRGNNDSSAICAQEPVNTLSHRFTKKSRRIYVIVVTILGGVVLALCCIYILYRRKMKAKGRENRGRTDRLMLFSNESERQVNDLMMHENNQGSIDVPFYNLDVILSATDNFSDANMLGRGGFGPVYKGKFPGGSEIAVKRLSSFSGQGIEEFRNEVILIAKLQHRNLVRLLGYCITEKEKILLYEYMPNRSLDAFIFDQNNCLLLDWNQRFNIILGIARGLLYLHQDSRLRIIHRDMKTSNILLDEDMNPKISDFGLAKIVEGKETEASTNRVVGTYGYMSPEYALDGKFSIKSDVFSFGVVMLEIISGKKNTGFYNPQQVLNLLGYAWGLWIENKAIELVDPVVVESCEECEVMKCINVGLLCVQEDPNDRPSMSTVVVMIGSENTTSLPNPTKPAFVVRRHHSSTSSSTSTKPATISTNLLTVSMEEGR
ncbi:PREDICTED: G-type lectin S-receptor-like serine/threonine-protein kinase At4g03230 isoform X1 [Erythranthe guttata]|uniref:G-type lectin S-receptor-like serine/threonine-protein kinase At4g03230 isoform X1 n=2 Tax=Erythranthe guttata TaxID=4155 RepID=UPI00064DEEA5|nr:PREDICTED: G-type lectin S-receptor-like serine/threonine-protein kinase At4g03230 isoform X1 [Erythranthe guttata]|eukprot:XP_012830070.1 PREDICTED: G-type lectin S-receptor-like serine/threonine-protein kinase At4g03230 isoform X1 [Erythranthe guttata]